MTMRFHLPLWGTLFGVCSTTALAQSLPDAGSMLQQIEGRQTPPEQALRRVPVVPTGPAAAPQGPTVVLRSIRFEGNTVLSTAELAQLVAPWLGTPLAFSELQVVGRVVASAYRKAGYLARADFGPQDLTAGVATMRITEARFGAVRLEGEPPARLPAERLQQGVAASQTSGELLQASAIDRALLLADDLAGVAVAGKLVAGQNPGETDMVFNVVNEPLVSGKVQADNFGARSTGEARLYGQLGFASPLSLGDQAGLAWIHSEGSDYLNASYTVPVGAQGWQVGVAASYLDYKLTSSELRALNATGNSNTLELQTSYPVVRSATANLYAGFTVANKNYENKVLDVLTSDYNVRSATLALWGNKLDSPEWWGGKGSNSAYLAWSHGNLDLDGSPNQLADSLGPQAAGAYNVLRWQAMRQQPLGDSGLNLNLRYSGQAANKNLDSSEKLYLGGPSGIRAYPVSEGGGSSGQQASIELQANVHKNLRLTGFVDWGRVKNRSSQGSDAYDLSGVGLALDLLGFPGVQTQLVWSHRLGNNPAPLANGHDQDGSYKRNRFWLSAGFSF